MEQHCNDTPDCTEKFGDHSQHRQTTETSGQPSGSQRSWTALISPEIATSDRRPGRDNYRPGVDQPRRPVELGRRRHVPKTTRRSRPDRAATPMMTLFPSASCRSDRRSPETSPYRYDGRTAPRPIDTVDRARRPQLSEICKAKRLSGFAATTESNVWEEKQREHRE